MSIHYKDKVKIVSHRNAYPNVLDILRPAKLGFGVPVAAGDAGDDDDEPEPPEDFGVFPGLADGTVPDANDVEGGVEGDEDAEPESPAGT